MSFLNGYAPQLLEGAMLTLQVGIVSLACGLLLGALGALGELSRFSFVRSIVIGWHTLIRGLPEILILFAAFYGSDIILNRWLSEPIEISPYWAGVLALGILFGAYASQVLRGALLAIHTGQREAALALGFSTFHIYQRILLPQIWRYALPGLGNLWLVLLKDTALVSLIGLTDLMSRAQAAVSITQKPFTFYITVAFIYLIFTSISQWLLHYWGSKKC